MTVHVVGNVCIDTTFRLQRFPQAGETLNAAAVSDGLGGKGANQAVAASRTGADVRFWSAIGHDETGLRIRALLAAEGLDTMGLAVLAGPSDRSSIFVDAAGENMIVSAVPSATAFDPLAETAFGSTLLPGDVVVLQGNLGPAATEGCLAVAKARGATTILNASPLPPDGGMAIADVDILIVNAVEAAMLSGRELPEAGALALLEHGPGCVILTLGSAGAVLGLAGSQDLVRIAVPAVAVVDTSGAGDVFCGVVSGLVALGIGVEPAARLAVQAASLAVTRPGTLSSCPSAAEIAALRAGATELPSAADRPLIQQRTEAESR